MDEKANVKGFRIHLAFNFGGICSFVILQGPSDIKNARLIQMQRMERKTIDILHQECVKLYPSGLRELIYLPTQFIYWPATDNKEYGIVRHQHWCRCFEGMLEIT